MVVWKRGATVFSAISVLVGCSSEDSALRAEPHTASGAPTDASAPESTEAPAGQEVSTPTSPCDGFVPLYIGQGLTTSLPAGSSATGGEGTADAVAVHAGWAAFFVVDDTHVAIGRRVGTSVVAEANSSQRADDGVVTYVTSDDQPLRDCLLELTSYDRAKDEKDE